jgi:hypothetical protein
VRDAIHVRSDALNVRVNQVGTELSALFMAEAASLGVPFGMVPEAPDTEM